MLCESLNAMQGLASCVCGLDFACGRILETYTINFVKYLKKKGWTSFFLERKI